MKYKTMTQQRKSTEETREKLAFYVKSSKTDIPLRNLPMPKQRTNSIKKQKDYNSLFAAQIKKLM